MKKILLPIFLLFFFGACTVSEKNKGGLPSVETLPIESAGSSSVVLRGRTQGGVTDMLSRGVCFSTSDVFTFRDSPSVSTDAGEGEFALRTYELVPKQQYYMKAFAVMRDGTIVYGATMTFSTTDYQLPTVSVSAATDVLATEATLHGKVESEGDYPVSSRGFVYTDSETATLKIGEAGVSSVMATLSGDGFIATVGELEIGRKYRLRAYATTEYGAGYSDEISFTTLNVRPVEFSAVTVLENTFTTLKVQSSITDLHGANVESFGFCWSNDNALPQVKNSPYKVTDSNFTLSFDDVKPGRVFYVRPYAKTIETGYNYGNVLRVKVTTYDCDGGMVKVVPVNPVYIGWLGDYDQPEMPAKYSRSHDGVFAVNMSVGKNETPTPSAATVQPFCIAKYEVTNDWYCRFLNAYGSTTVKDGTWKGKELVWGDYADVRYENGTWTVDDARKNCPAVGVTWFGALEFCAFFGGFLPNEAQWEIAARGNVYSNDASVPMYKYSGSDNLDDVAVWNKSSCEPVGQKAPNQLGLYDMSGNAQEMTSSWYGYYKATYTENAMSTQKNIVLRGGRAQRGKADIFQNNARDAYVVTAPAKDGGGNSYSQFIGFRFACTPDDE